MDMHMEARRCHSRSETSDSATVLSVEELGYWIARNIGARLELTHLLLHFSLYIINE
jgi:hypothetical protein